MESSRPKEERKTREHITPGNGNRHEKNEQEFDGTRKEGPGQNQVAALRIIGEQSIEWNSSLYINFIDYEKPFDRVDRTTLWKLLRHYGVPE
ncbi:unnamed protein product [Schistosoma margrebowiei]|uniref:Uncharacterized protein n=1 Tax=Schistosoma margrebowiei TaxID=48269 RepID=A0A183LCK2_9TREM|nr:unnamed protein product [Schistosoma margrebowiei]